MSGQPASGETRRIPIDELARIVEGVLAGNGFSRAIRIRTGYRVLTHIKELGKPNHITHVGASDRFQFRAKYGWWH